MNNGQKLKKLSSNPIFVPLISMILCGIIYFSLAINMGIKPFGDCSKTLAVNDVFYQYLDFFAWYKDILTGKASFIYSFSNGLGQNSIGLFTTYLLSPINLIIVFFPKEKLDIFYNIIVLLKMVLCAGTMGLFLEKRYLNTRKIYQVLLALSYGMMPFLLFQSFNMMWLDASYMLPLILLGVYISVKDDKTWILSLMVGLTIIIQWYQGAVASLFSGFFFLSEVFIFHLENNRKIGFKVFLLKAVNYVKGMVVGVMISAFVLIPTFYVLSLGKASSLDFSNFRNEMLGDVTNTILLNYPGARSGLGQAGIFCGCFVILGVLGFFVQKKEKLLTKIIGALLLSVLMLAFYWRPMFFIFSLFRMSTNFHYRFSYVACFTIIYLAGNFYSKIDKEETLKYVSAVFFYIVAYALLNIRSVGSLDSGRLFIIAEPIISILLILLMVLLIEFFWKKKIMFRILEILLVAIIIFETGMSAKNIILFVNTKNEYDFTNYQINQLQMISNIKDHDNGIYKLSQNQNRTMDYQKESVCFNESMAFDYMGVSSYTSCPDNNQMNLLSSLGYKVYDGSMTIKNMTLVPVDSVFNVKYVLSPYSQRELNKTSLPNLNDCDVYLNPYCFPMMFKVSSWVSDVKLNSDDVFANWNSLYKSLGNSGDSILSEAEYQAVGSEDETIYKISIPEGNYSLYGRIVTDNMKLSLNLNNEFSIPYGNDLNSDVFYVPFTDEREVEVSVNTSDENIKYAQFVLVDMDILEGYKTNVDSKSASLNSINNNKVEAMVEGKEGEFLFTNIPYDKGWRIKVNGELTEPKLYSDTIILIPLSEGTNKIDMAYYPPYLLPAIFISLCGITLTVINSLKKKP